MGVKRCQNLLHQFPHEPGGCQQKAPPVLWMTQSLQAVSIWWPHVCAADFTFHSTWGLPAANSPHQLPKQSLLSLTAGSRILRPVHRDRCQATGALLPDSRAPETADMDWISPQITLTQPRLQDPPPAALSKAFRGQLHYVEKDSQLWEQLTFSHSRRGEGWCQQQKWYL